MNFSSDNASGASPQVLRAIVEANPGTAAPYGMDPWTAAAPRRPSELSERERWCWWKYSRTMGVAAAAVAITRPKPIEVVYTL